jgi:glycosyltransferase
MQDKLLTIVVPTYNISQYIEKCINSFLEINAEYYKYFEVIVVNDGSTDDSVEVVESLVKNRNMNIKIISKENGGHGSTINKGIKEAKGKYFKVVDGDDWVNVDNFKKLIDKLQTVDADIIITDFSEQHIYNNSQIIIDFKDEFVSDKKIIGIPRRRIPMHALTYKTSILKDNNIKISEKTFYVDMEYTLLPLKYVKDYIYYNLDVYQYFLGRPDQSMNINVMKKKYNHHNRVTRRILDLYNEVKKEDKLRIILDDALEYLVNKQCLLFLMNGKKIEVHELFKYCERNGYRWKFNLAEKTTTLFYIDYKTKGILRFIINPLINKKAKKLGGTYAD